MRRGIKLGNAGSGIFIPPPAPVAPVEAQFESLIGNGLTRLIEADYPYGALGVGEGGISVPVCRHFHPHIAVVWEVIHRELVCTKVATQFKCPHLKLRAQLSGSLGWSPK